MRVSSAETREPNAAVASLPMAPWRTKTRATDKGRSHKLRARRLRTSRHPQRATIARTTSRNATRARKKARRLHVTGPTRRLCRSMRRRRRLGVKHGQDRDDHRRDDDGATGHPEPNGPARIGLKCHVERARLVRHDHQIRLERMHPGRAYGERMGARGHASVPVSVSDDPVENDGVVRRRVNAYVAFLDGRLQLDVEKLLAA